MQPFFSFLSKILLRTSFLRFYFGCAAKLAFYLDRYRSYPSPLALFRHLIFPKYPLTSRLSTSVYRESSPVTEDRCFPHLPIVFFVLYSKIGQISRGEWTILILTVPHLHHFPSLSPFSQYIPHRNRLKKLFIQV